MESLLQCGLVRDVGGEAQLDLAIVDGQQRATFRRNESLADFAPLFGSDRNVL